MIETAADLAAMFDTDAFAVSASYTPAGGSAVSVSALLDAPDETLAIGRVGVNLPRRVVLVRVAELPAAARGDVLAIEGETLTVRSAKLDPTGKLWTLECSD